MKNYIRILTMITALMFGAVSGAWAQLTSDDIEIDVKPSVSAGSISKSVSGREVTLTVTPATGYYIKASDIVVEKLVNTGKANAPKRRTAEITDVITGKMYSGGSAQTDDNIISSVKYPNSAQYVFTLPADYDGAYVTARFHLEEEGNSIRITRNTSLGENPDMSKHYVLVEDVSATVVDVFYSKGTFSGTFEGEPKADGSFPTISGLEHALFQTVDGGTVKNIVLDNVTIAGSTYYTSVTVGNQSKKATGAIANVATGTARIYNCGIQATGSSVTTDKDGYTLFSTALDAEDEPQHTVSSSTVGGVDYVGGLVGFLDGTARVINCYSYADITSGSFEGGIVGRNNVATTASNLKTMVMNCMFYGNLASGDKAPIYNGEIITNVGENTGVSNFNYFWAGAPYVQIRNNINTYNCALTAETRYLQRFEFFRHLLNGHRELAAWWVQGDGFEKDEMAKWVMEPSQIGTTTPYPILKAQGKYPSVVNYEPSDETIDANNEHYNEGRKLGTLSVTIRMGSNSPYDAPSGARLKSGQSMTLTLPITDKDPAHFNFNFGKVQLPYYNDYGIGNYTGNRVVTGWKIVAISGGTHGFSTGDDATASVNDNGDITLTTPYNFADRKCTDKDKFEVSGRVFSQGAYFDVPEGVSSIIIEPYWAKAVFLADASPDLVYDTNMETAYNVPNVGGNQLYTNGNSYLIAGESQVVYTTASTKDETNAITGLFSGINENTSKDHSVYDYAIVLVGNYHHYSPAPNNHNINGNKNRPYTLMSIDNDHDNEPDYSLILRYNGRTTFHPIRFDFLNIPGLGMAQKSTEGKGTYNLGIMQTLGWFESTNTSLFRFTQFEYDKVGRQPSPMILQGGVIEQWVTMGQKESSTKEGKTVTYYHVGGNVWFKEFHIGVHQDKTQDEFVSPHPPISVTGGDYNEFYLTGMYNTPNNNYDDNAECYINGGRFDKVAGTGMQGIGGFTMSGTDKVSYSNGNITWQIDNADINEFYGGGINAAHIAEGNIMTVISNSRVDQFCGGPKFGNMNSDKKVVTNATNCTFRTFFGAGYGGNSYNRRYPSNRNSVQNTTWNSWVSSEYTNKYDSKYGGVETRIDYQFIPMSDNTSNVARLFVDYVSFSLATTHNVTSKLTDCTITTSPLGSLELFSQSVGNFYGGGNLGMVDGPVKSTLTNCTVEGNVFGGGYSATLPTVAVMNNSFQTEPYYDSNLGAYLDAELPTTVAYTWQHLDEVNSTATAIDTDNHILYTQETLTGLGAVTGNVTLTIDGYTTLTNGKRMSVSHSVYGGGEESNVAGNTQVNITGGTITQNVFGGGKGEADEFTCSKAMVGVNNAGSCADPGSNDNKEKGTKVTISNGIVNGNVYGGGEVGRVEWNTQVKIGVGTGDGPFAPVINGSVFGAGKGKDTHGYAALVRGNSSVTIQGNAKVLQNVYGGGEQATVGRYWVKSIPTDLCPNDPNETVVPTAPSTLPDEMPYKTRRGGKCTVIVQGNAQVGPDGDAPATAIAGHVFGAGKGVTPNYNNTPNDDNRSKRMVDYNASKHTGEPGTTWDYYPDNHAYVWEYFVDDADPTAANYKTGEDKYLEFLQTLALVTGTDVTIDGSAAVKGSVYGGSESGYVQDDTDVKVSGGTIGTEGHGGVENGNVYGGGKGDAEHTGANHNYVAAGLVKGNTKVEIEDGRIWHNVYGGGAYGSVGQFTYDANTGMPTERVQNTTGGKAEVIITGGTIGKNGSENGMVFGSSRGDVGAPGEIHDKLAWVYDTEVKIGTDGSGSVFTTPTIKGSVYGGGENGHVFNDADVYIYSGTVGIPTGETIGDYSGAQYPYRGNVYGAGCGTDKYIDANDDNKEKYNPLAGIVRRNASVNISGGHVVHNVYGAGAMGSVGTIAKYTSGDNAGKEKITKHENLTNGFGLSWPYEFEYDTYIDTTDGNKVKKTGKATVTITGGRIGTDGDGNGYVYGAARGAVEVGESDIEKQRYVEALLANVRETEVIINYSTTPSTDDLVTIQSGTNATIINSNETPCITGAVFGGGEDGHVYENAKVDIRGGLIGNSVYGGGRGKSTYRGKLKSLSNDAEYETDISSWIAGKVYGNVDIIMTGGHVVRNIYGGGNLGSVGKGNYASGADDYYTAGYGETLTGNLWTTTATAASPDNAWHFLNSGKITVKVQAGTVGMSDGIQDGLPVGCIFGSSRGRAAADVGNKSPRYKYAPDFYLGYANETEVEIGKDGEETGPTLWGSVYGGGRDGHVRRHTKVTVYGGTIGKECTSSSNPTGIQWTERGNVFGSGSGMGMYDSDNNGTADKHGTSSGSVTGWTQVYIKGGTIYQNVYGGGALSSVGAPKLSQTSEEYRKGDTAEGHGVGKQTICQVNIEGGIIGTAAGFDKGYGGNVFAAGRGGGLISGEHAEDYATSIWSELNVSNGTIYGSAFGGGEQGLVRCGVDVNITGGDMKHDVYGGGAKAHTNTSNWAYDKANKQWGTTWADATAKSTTYTTNVNLTGGTIRGNAYGGGLGEANENAPAFVYGDVTLKLNESVANNTQGCAVHQLFGANNALGSPKGDVEVHVYKTQNKSRTTIADKFKLDNESLDKLSTSETDAQYIARLKVILADKIAIAKAVSIATQSYETTQASTTATATDLKTAIGNITTAINGKNTDDDIKNINSTRYDVYAVYGGGNEAAYEPVTPNNGTTGSKTQVIIEGCGLTSIATVYGGGNAAAVPETNVEIKESYEIGYLFGGGNGKDKKSDGSDNPGADVGTLDHGTTAYGTGYANSTMKGGYIHEAYGGSNQKGVIKVGINQTSDPEGSCDLVVDKIVGAGKYADIDGDVNMTLSCQPSTKVPLLFAGADEANVNGNITLNITNGNFGKVFGGNNLGGAVKGKITVNVQETGCQPIKIDELYLGGNEAAYSIYGYYESDETHDVTGLKILKPRTSADDGHTPVTNPTPDATHTFPYAQPVLNIISCTYIGEVFGGGYGEGAVMYANPTVNVNLVPGRYADGVPEMMNSLGLSADAYANPNNVGIIRNVYGGGNAANVAGNTTVNIATEYLVKEVTVGDDVSNLYTRDTNESYTQASGTALENVTYYEKSSAYIIGSVFGGGNAADVLGNTNVTMSDGYVFNGIFGGGYAGNVGTFTRSTATADVDIFGHTAHDGCIGKPVSCAANTGKCTVLVNGGQIGPYTVATLGMNRPKAQGGPVPEGWVWGAGQGLIEDPAKEPDTHFKSYVGSTDVTIGGTAFVLESIIGGGEFGRVLGDTKVTITGNCQIGVGAGKVDTSNKPIRYTDAQFVNPLTTPITSGTNGNALAECSHFPYGADTNDDGIKDTFLPYDPYYDDNKTYADAHDLGPASTSDPSDGKTWIGCVFAGGSGYMPYLKKDNNGNDVGYDWCSSAGWVEGNTNLTISGGHILTNVYGGNEYTNVKGKCKVTMTGGTIGVPRTVQQIIDHPLTCYLFGAGKGDPRPHFNTETNVGEVEVEILGGTIYGSVFGGGEDGHVERDVKLTIGKDDHTGPTIGTWGTTYVDGNIFGGGRGFAGDAYTAGNVAGSVDLDIKGGTILGSIYGGGRLGSVGYGLYPPSKGDTYYGAMRPDNTGDDDNNTAIANFKRGYVDVEITGGTIGNSYEYIIPSAANTPSSLNIANIATWTDANWTTWKTHNNIPLTEFDKATYRLKHTKGGNVFAGGMGRLYQLDGVTPITAVNWWKVGCVKQTKLTVKGGTIKSNVYGGGELGAVKPYVNNTTVQGGKTEIIIKNDNNTQIGTEIQDGSNVTQYTFGSVYGGGYGSTIENLNGTDDTTTENDNPKFVAGLVHGDTEIDMQGGKVLASVYGGGEVASVNGKADVKVSGGEVGKDKVGNQQFGGASMGNVYGGGSGHPNIVRCGRILKNTKVTISGTDTKIYHNVYGGGAYGTVGEFTYTTGTDGKVNGVTGLKTAGTGTAEVIITGGIIGTDGHENGMIFGSSRGDVNEPGARDDHTAWVYDAKVTIGTSGQGTTLTTPLVKGSVYGSGENGHTFNDAIVNMYSGTVGITDTDIDGGARYTLRGNVYGGGCGTDIYTKNNKRRYNPLAGIVYGTTTVNMTGGHVVHDVFGGGAMGSVGKFTFDSNGKPTGIAQGAATNSGKCILNISGGKIGITSMQMTATGGPDDYGHVFGAGRGEVKDTTLYDNLNVTGYVNSTEVNISGTAFVTGSVYGGAESGHVLGNTLVQVSGGQIGCGVGKTAAYTPDEWAAASPSTLAPCASWTYTANGAPYDPNAGADNYDSKGGATTATDGHTFYGNVFGGGSGYYQYSPGIWIRSAGRVEGNTSVVISGGHILSNVYGGNECTDVFGSATISMTGGTVGVPRTQAQIETNPVLGHIYGAGKGDKRVLFNTWTNVASTSVSLTGGKVYGSVYGGGEDGHVLGNAVTTINGADLVIGCDGTSGYDGNVFGGGQGSSTALTAGVVGGNVTLNIQDGTMKGSVYGGGRLAAVGTHFENPDGDNYGQLHSDNPTLHGNISVNLTGGKIYQDVFGGGMGVTNVDNADRFAISRNVTVHLNEGLETTATGCIVKGRIFGANNANASPKGDVLVHIHATQNEGTNNIATKASDYDVSYVFGGGNNADYVPATDNEKQSTEVIIEGCDLTSIQEVYGGGYGAATPGTKVEIRGTKIIDNVFGGGYGAGQNNPGANVGIRTDGTTEYGNTGTGVKTAVVRLMAGNVNNVYGGSNTKGDIRGGSSITNIEKTGSQGTNKPCCDNLNVNNIYGGGKDAPMEGGAEIVLGCMPNDWISEIYAGAENAHVGNDVSLTLTSGKFGRVFGGNKSGGKLDGHIEVNIEESETCGTPIIIGELYGGGNLAPYSIYGYNEDGSVRTEAQPNVTPHNSPRVNVYRFTSIGNIFGGGLGANAVMVGSPTVNINEVAFDKTVTDYKANGYDPASDTSKPEWLIDKDYAGDRTGKVVLYPHVDGNMGVIGNVFGGGNAAQVTGDTYVNIGTEASVKFESILDNTIEGDDKRVSKSVVGADIRGNVFGGGNNAAVTGDSHVTIGKEEVVTSAPAPQPNPAPQP